VGDHRRVGMRARRLRLLGLLLALVLAATSCTGDDRPEQAGTERPPSTAASASGSPQTSPLGVKWDWGRVDRYTPFLQRLTGGATFFELVWCDVEPERGRLDWSRVDQVARSSGELGFTLFLKIRVGGDCWATGGEGGFRRGRRVKTASAVPVDLDAYQSFVRTAVARYAPMGVHQYALENEVNAPSFWQGTPADYEELARLGAAAVRSADPDARVLDSGLVSTVYGKAMADRLLAAGHDAEAVGAYQRYYARRFLKGGRDLPRVRDAAGLRRVLADSGTRRDLAFLDVSRRLAQERVVDAWQLHFYESWDNLPALMGYLRETLPPAFPVQAWEVGNFWPGGPQDQRLRAEEVTKAVATLLAEGVRPVIWLPLAYNPTNRDEEIRLGLVAPDGTVRAAGQVVASLAAAGRGAVLRPVGKDGVSGVAFGQRDRSTLVVWSDRGVTLPAAGAPDFEVRTLDDGHAPVAGGGSGLRLGPEPVRITVARKLEDALKLLG
jgi:hypothetical protein